MIVGVDLKQLQPLDFYRKFFSNDVRPDGRNLTEVRPFGISMGSISTADGSSLIKFGHTTAVCGIKTELLKERPIECQLSHLVTVNVDLSPMCSSLFRSGPTNEHAHIANQFLIDVLNNSKCISLSDLLIPDTTYCYRLHCDVQFLNYDGNSLDAATAALISALTTVRLPKVKINSKTGELEIKQGKKRLTLLNHPVSTSFIIFDEDIILIDPTSDEESVASSKLTIAITDGNKISNIFKPGGVRISDENLENCISLAKERATIIRNIILTKTQ